MTLSETILGQLLQVFRTEGIMHNSEQELIERLRIPEHEFNAMFSSMEDLVQQVVQHDFQVQEERDRVLLSYAQNPVEEIILVLQNGIKEMNTINPAYILDLQQHFPQAWQMVLGHLGTYNHDLNFGIINNGIVQGYFRKDINLQLVVKIILEQFNMLVNPTIFPPDRFDLGEVFRSIYLYYVRGLCTEKGVKLAEAYFAKNNM